MRFRLLLPQLLLSLAIAFATGHLWLLLLPMLVLLLLLGQTATPQPNQPLREISGRLWFGNRRLGKLPWLWPSIAREQVLLHALHSRTPELGTAYWHELARQEAHPLLGIAPEGHPVRLAGLTSFGHALIVGGTGSGKTELLKQLLPQLSGSCWCADYKGGTGIGNLLKYQRVTTNLDANRELFWQAAFDELAERERAQSAGQELQALYLAVDELAVALGEPLAHKSIEAIARKGRSLSMHLMVASQNLSGLPRAIWTNLQSRILLAPADPTDALQLGIDATIAKSLDPHHGVLRTPNETTLFSFPKSKQQAIIPITGRNPLLNFSGQAAKDF